MRRARILAELRLELIYENEARVPYDIYPWRPKADQSDIEEILERFELSLSLQFFGAMQMGNSALKGLVYSVA